MTELMISIAIWCGSANGYGTAYTSTLVRTTKEVNECRDAVLNCLNPELSELNGWLKKVPKCFKEAKM